MLNEACSSSTAVVLGSGVVPSSAIRVPRQVEEELRLPSAIVLLLSAPCCSSSNASGCMISTRSNRTCLCCGLAAKRISLIAVSSVQPGPGSSVGHRSTTPGSHATVTFSSEDAQRLKSPVSTAIFGSERDAFCACSLLDDDQGVVLSTGKMVSSCAFLVGPSGPVLSKCTVASRTRHPDDRVTSAYKHRRPM